MTAATASVDAANSMGTEEFAPIAGEATEGIFILTLLTC
jgi:hypothetical protein